ncbi:hypothetical protein FFLO_06315 [Filobasidium floriforme]|uniref:BolA-like protein n=1 Tax=Filobasidium floriforme TaxID=5210 RepID=A0A8K0JF52_9TREE|nr:hypothetical protein FFLO_06315 [Filobasidium floriforme]
MAGAAMEHQIGEILRSNLEIQDLEIVDISANCGTSFSIVVVSPAFQGKGKLARHKLVNSLLADQIATLHAFSQKPLTPAEWEKEKEKRAAATKV